MPRPASPAAAPPRPWATLVDLSHFVRLSHTLFSLPLVAAGLLIGAGGIPRPRVLLLTLLAAIGARLAGMALNRIIDREIDAANPRTQARELPRGALSLRQGQAVVVLGLATYFSAAVLLGPWTALLSPIPVVVLWLYPYLKRFTAFCHVGVGLALALAPLGAWLAVTQSFANVGRILPLGLFGLAWVTGFDIIYATLDLEFDRSTGIHSLPARLGRAVALRLSALLHAGASASLLLLGVRNGWSWSAAPALALAIGLLYAEQRLSHRVQLAFFRINIGVGFAVLAYVALGVLSP